MRPPSSPMLTIEHALLGFLYARPMHGYQLYQQLSAQGGLWQVWRLKQGQLYALLARLQEHGAVTVAVQQQAARPPRKVYSLTGPGESAFLHWLHTPVGRGRQMRIEFLAKLYFACRQPPAVVDHLLTQQAAVCSQWLAELREQGAPPCGPPSSQPADLEPEMFTYAVQQFRVNQIESFLTWLTTCRVYLAAQGEG